MVPLKHYIGWQSCKFEVGRNMQRAMAAVGLVIALSLAGCASDGNKESRDEVTSPVTEPIPEPTGEPVQAPNLPPLANLTASETEGYGKVQVIFTLNGTDPDAPEGDENETELPEGFEEEGNNSVQMDWVLDVTGNGTEVFNGSWLPVDITYTYTEVGEFLATLVVSDGRDVGISVVNVTVYELPDPYFTDDAEAPSAWTTGNYLQSPTNGVNHPIATGWHTTEDDAAAGSKSWTHQTSLIGGYADHEYSEMISPPIDLSDAPSAGLFYMLAGGSEDGWDFLYVHVSADGGTTWDELESHTGDLGDWVPMFHDLAAYVGGVVQLRFLFDSDETCSAATPITPYCGTTMPGWFVDDIIVAAF